ncbi:NAD(P)H-dependent oxidoreductase subunit E [Capillimicrobium parvum]|uniref:Ion-translocating oxidoreductase complex subunit C n=1 Tax=Capillimicrobium parvum TaxID=2884022 RepID=A0A9E6XTN6_9ACTN|nr:NAD(P)H-dependent oxidoreductase subunit E [Capillimicrobium parvum]UGS34308.1 Ion-translocating oxidoreductase complex subunit C [Capillimicrobium parvum]
MSKNLVELIRRHHELDAPTALEVLKAAVDDHGAITDDDRRVAAERSGLPEATVYGVSTFYDDLLHPRGRRHVRVCTGSACFATTGDRHVDELRAGFGLELGECSDDGEISLAETVCLGFCHAAPAVRDGDVIDAGPGVVERVLAGATVAATEPDPVSTLDRPVLTEPTDWSGLRRALTESTPEGLLEAVKAADVRGRGGAGFPAGNKWQFARAAAGDEKFIVANGDEGDPGSYIDKVLMEANPALLVEGMALAGYAVGAQHGFVLTRSEYPRSKPALEAAVEEARAAGLLGEDVLGTGFDFDITIVEGAGSYVVGEETALLACLQGLRGTVSARPPFPAERGVFGLPTVVNNVETLCNIPFIARHGADAYRDLSPGATPGSKLVCFNERFVRPGVYEVRFGTTMRELCEDLAGGLRDGRSIKALQIGGPLGGILPGWKLDTPFDFAELAAEGCMVGHGGILAFDDQTNMRDVARHLLHFGAAESCGKCFPCRIGLRRAHEMFSNGAPVSQSSLEALLETLELGSLCAHGGGMPAPIRSLLTHFPDELRLAA